MSNKKGFTLAELLGVLAILAIVSLITVPLVNKYITNSRQKAYNTEMTTLKNAAQQWVIKNYASIEWNEENYYALNLNDLKQSEFLANEPIYNPLHPDEEITGCIIVTNNSGVYNYVYSSTCTIMTYAFDFTGGVQSVTLPSGIYKIEAWGAQGGTSGSGTTGGLGGYSVGIYKTSTEKTLYIYVGEQGKSYSGTANAIGTAYNGGASGSTADVTYDIRRGGGGGGATDIRTTNNTTYSDRIIVAGGGGGAGYNYAGGAGGGSTGTTGASPSNNYYSGTGGTQSLAGRNTWGSSGGLGYGGNGAAYGTGYGAGAGGGYYGGGGGYGYEAGGGGGAGYIGGVSTSDGITKAMYCYNCSASSAAATLTYSTTNASLTATAKYAKLGNGYVKITRIG